MEAVKKEWIPIWEEKPALEEKVLLTIQPPAGRSFVATGYRFSDNKWHVHQYGNSNSKNFTVKAWKKLPAPYKQ